MNSLEQQVESIVRQVLARLVNENPQQANTKAIQQPKTAAHTSNESSNSILPFKVLSVKELQSLDTISSRIVIKRGTVVTPAAKEWLKEKKIELAWATDLKTNATTKQHHSSAKQIVIGQTEKSFNTASLTQQLRQRGHAIEQLASSGLASLVTELADHVTKNGAIGILVTNQTWSATVHANRNAGVNAVHCKDRLEAMNAMKQLKINFLIVNPSGQSSHSIINMIHEITA